MENLAEFKNSLEQAGINPGTMVPDGKYHRFSTSDKPGDKAGWYKYDGKAGAFGDWRTGIKKSFGHVTPEERQACLQADTKKHREAAIGAQKFINGVPDADPDDPYPSKKGVKPCPGLKRDSDGNTIVSVKGPDSKFIAYQKISPDGKVKKFLPYGCTTKGGHFIIEGNDGKIYIAEGIATALSIHEATGCMVICAFNAGNLEAVARMIKEKYPDSEIIICGDDDTQTPGNPGRTKAEAAARSIGAKVAFPVFKTNSGTDFNDLHVSEGLEAVKQCLGLAKLAKLAGGGSKNTVFEWSEPIPLIGTDFKNSLYPVEALPAILKDAVIEVTNFVQSPIEMAAISAIIACSTIISGLVDIERAENLKGPTSINSIVDADSGERKTTVDKFFTEPIRNFESNQYETMKPEIAKYKAAFSSWEARKNGLLNAIKDNEKKGKSVHELEERLKTLECSMPIKSRVPRYLLGDTTTEALTWGLAHDWPVASIISSEGGLVLGAHALSPDQSMKTYATFNSLWGAETIVIDRKTSDSYRINSARLTIGIAIQHETLKRFIENSKGLFRGSGFFARFLVAMPESKQGYRPFKEPPKYWPALTIFHNRLFDLLREPLNFNENGYLEPLVLKFSPDAKQVWVTFYNDIEKELLPGGELTDNKDVASKAADNVARLAALFHVLEKGLQGQVQTEHVESAARLVAWHLVEAKRFTGQLALSRDTVNVIRLDSWVIEYCRKNHVTELTTSDILQKGPSCVRKKLEMDLALSELQDLNRVKRIKENKKSIIKINPELLEVK